MDGICTLGNDYVFDQIIALINSIDAIYDGKMPICIYPYDNNLTRLRQELIQRPHVQIYDYQKSIEEWDAFVRSVWDTHPTARITWQKVGSKEDYYRVGTHRRFCAFDGPFDRFVYMDADTLLMQPLDRVFSQLNQHGFVSYDYQAKDLGHVYNVNSNQLNQVFSSQSWQSRIFCSGFYASKHGLFDQTTRKLLLDFLSRGDAEILYPMAPDQTVLNYMVMRSGLASCNLGYSLPLEERTGNSVTSTHFQNRDNVLFDGDKQLTYLHYIGLSSKLFKRVAAGDNIDFPYRDIFLHYRFLHEPEKRPEFNTKARPYNAPMSFRKKVLRKLGIPVEV